MAAQTKKPSASKAGATKTKLAPSGKSGKKTASKPNTKTSTAKKVSTEKTRSTSPNKAAAKKTSATGKKAAGQAKAGRTKADSASTKASPKTHQPKAATQNQAKPSDGKAETFYAPVLSHMPRILVTGISGHLGRLVARRLHRFAEVHGVDTRPFIGKPKDVTMHHADLRKKRCEDVFRSKQFDAVLHLGVEFNPRRSDHDHYTHNILGTRNLLRYAHQYGVKKFVLLSSATIYGASPLNPHSLTEDSPLLAGVRFAGVRDLIELDMMTQSFFWKHDNIETVILRPVHIVGPSMENPMSQYLRQAHPLVPLGFDPMIQLLHEDDMVRAVERALKPGIKGIYNITGACSTPLHELLEELERSTVPVPHPILSMTLKRLWSLGLSDIPPEVVDYLRFICTVDGSRARRELGYEPLRSVKETLRSLRTES